MARGNNGIFVVEARIYPPNEYRNFTREQRQKITELKVQQGWVDGNTPPHGFVLDSDGRPQPSNQLVAAVRASMIGEVSTTTMDQQESTAIVPLPPPPSTSAGGPVPPMVMTNPMNAGQSFGRAGSRVVSSNNSTIATVTVNGRSFSGPVFDGQGNRIA